MSDVKLESSERYDADFSAPQQPPRVGTSVVATLRWAWRSLTAMRTALILLLLLALAAIPGSVLPQRGTNPLGVSQYLRDHPSLGPWLSRFGFFDVYGAPWFAAIYLALFVSLAGCVIPRLFRQLRTLRARPPRTPRFVSRLPISNTWTTDVPAEKVVAAAWSHLRSRRFRADKHEETVGGSVSAEKGYLYETGNLLFHISLLVLLVAVALGGLYGYKGTVLVKVGDGFSNTLTSYDSFTPARLTSPAQLAPFSFTLKKFEASYIETGANRGTPSSFHALVSYSSKPGAQAKDYDLKVNHPLQVDGAKVYLVGHGYAPHFVVRDGTGDVVFDAAVPFLPQDSMFSSEGVVKVPDAKPQQLGFQGFFLPTGIFDPQRGPVSIFPAAKDPLVVLLAYKGNLGLGSGVPQSVYTLDEAHLTKLEPKALREGQTMTLPDGLGSLTFTGYEEWATFQVTHDPGRGLALLCAIAVMAGLLLSLTVRRRRIWLRAVPGEDGRTLVEFGGLSRSDSDAFGEEFAKLTGELQEQAAPLRPAQDEHETEE
jgi:cytochrome c biogenesis protein